MGLFSKVGKAISGGLIGGAKKAAGSLLGAAAGSAADSLFPSPDPYTKHLKRSIQWRVADAKAAGVHPLFALGASIGSPVYPSGGNSSQVAADVASGVSYGFGAPQRATQQKMATETHGAALTESASRTKSNLASAARDEAAALELQSRMARNIQRANAIQDKVGLGGNTVTLPGLGAELKTGPSTTAQEFEDEYGDAASWVYGIGRLGVDSWNSARKAVRKKSTLVVPRGRKTRTDPLRGLY